MCFQKGCARYPKHRKRGIVEILAKVEPKEVQEEVICEPDRGDFLGFELEGVVNKRKGELFKDKVNHKFELKMLPSFELIRIRSMR